MAPVWCGGHGLPIGQLAERRLPNFDITAGGLLITINDSLMTNTGE